MLKTLYTCTNGSGSVGTCSVCATVAWGTITCLLKFVDEVGSTVFYRNICWFFATSNETAEADFSVNFTNFHCRMNIIQPTWTSCITSVCWHTRRWYFCSCSSHKTIPILTELVVTHLMVLGCYVTALSTGITQVLIMIARIGYEVKWNYKRTVGIKIDGSTSFLVCYNFGSSPISDETYT